MKIPFSILTLSIAFFVGCQGSGNTNATDTLAMDTLQVGPPPEAPPPNPQVEKIVDEQMRNSPFFKEIECCADEIRRKAEPCCCDAVVEKYRQMRASPGNTDFSKLKTSDPILSVCRKKKNIRNELERIDNPKPAGNKPSTDDLY